VKSIVDERIAEY